MSVAASLHTRTSYSAIEAGNPFPQRKEASDVAEKVVGGKVNSNCRTTLGHMDIGPPTMRSTRGMRSVIGLVRKKNYEL